MKKRNEFWVALAFLAPNLVGFLAFTFGPLVISLIGSFTTWSLRPSVPFQFIGFDNYRELLSDPNFWYYLYNTFYFLLPLPLNIFGSLCLAAFLCQKLEFYKKSRQSLLCVATGLVSLTTASLLWLTGMRDLAVIIAILGGIGAMGFFLPATTYRTVYYLPHFAAGAGTILLWLQLFNPNFGLFNQTIQAVGGLLGQDWQGPGWLTSTKSLLGFLPFPEQFADSGFGLGAREAIIIMALWAGLGGNQMILYIAAISNISPDLYEAADVDGASGWQRFFFITVPLVAPTTFFLFIMGIIFGLQGGFEQARIMTEGGPAGMTTTLTYYIYTQGFDRLDLGYGSAVAWVMFVFIFILTIANWKYGNRQHD